MFRKIHDSFGDFQTDIFQRQKKFLSLTCACICQHMWQSRLSHLVKIFMEKRWVRELKKQFHNAEVIKWSINVKYNREMSLKIHHHFYLMPTLTKKGISLEGKIFEMEPLTFCDVVFSSRNLKLKMIRQSFVLILALT